MHHKKVIVHLHRNPNDDGRIQIARPRGHSGRQQSIESRMADGAAKLGTNVVKSFDTAKPRRHDDRSHRPRSPTPKNASSTTGSLLSAPATVGNIVAYGVVAKLGVMFVVKASRHFGHTNNGRVHKKTSRRSIENVSTDQRLIHSQPRRWTGHGRLVAAHDLAGDA
jgi:hypothetical protein